MLRRIVPPTLLAAALAAAANACSLCPNSPNRQTLPVAFTPMAPGRYQGRFPVQGNGEYVLSLVGKQGDKTIGPKTVGQLHKVGRLHVYVDAATLE